MMVFDLNTCLRYMNGIDFRILKCCILLIFKKNYEEKYLLDLVHVLRFKFVWKMFVCKDQTLHFTIE